MLNLNFFFNHFQEKFYLYFSLSYWLIISLEDTVYLETGHLIENFVNDWYLTTNTLNLAERLKCW